MVNKIHLLSAYGNGQHMPRVKCSVCANLASMSSDLNPPGQAATLDLLDKRPCAQQVGTLFHSK